MPQRRRPTWIATGLAPMRAVSPASAAWTEYDSGPALAEIRALPDAEGAHAYVGDLLIQEGNEASVRGQHRTLSRLCPKSWVPRDALEKAIAEAGLSPAP